RFWASVGPWLFNHDGYGSARLEASAVVGHDHADRSLSGARVEAGTREAEPQVANLVVVDILTKRQRPEVDLSVLVRGYCKRPLAVVIGEGSKGSASHGRAALGNRELADLEAAASTPFRQVPELQTSFAGAGCQHERGVGREQGQGFEGNGAPRISQ